MQIDPFWLIAAAAGGFFGAAIGALQSFIFCGLTVLLGVAGLFGNATATFISFVPFGPVLGPHIAFAGGVAAVAYAYRRGYVESGKDIVTPMMSIGKPDVLLVGAVFGMIGYLLQAGIAAVPWFGGHTDTVAVTVVVSALIVRFAFGRSGLVGHLPAKAAASTARPEQPIGGRVRYAPSPDNDPTTAATTLSPATGWARFAPTDSHSWIRYQEKFIPNSVLGLFAGGLAASVALIVAQNFPTAAGVAATIGFGLSAFSLFFLALGMSIPVTHHITLIGGVTAVSFLPVVDGNMVAALLIGAVCGMFAAWTAEFFSRFWHIHGDTHIDPPASSIWVMTTLVLGVSALLT